MDGKPVSYEEMQELLRKEVLGVSAGFDAEIASGRTELLLQGSGNDLAESRRAIEWIRLMLLHPNWTIANLPRIRDLVGQSLTGFRASMQGSEERWVNDPINGYYKQTDPLYLTTSSFLTGAHNVDRLRWMLTDAGTPQDRASINGFLRNLRGGLSHPATHWLDAKSPRTRPGNHQRPRPATPRSPRSHPRKGPALPLRSHRQGPRSHSRTNVAETRRPAASLLKTGNARMWMVGASDNLRKLEPDVQALAGNLRTEPRNVVPYSRIRRIDLRLREHQPDAVAPRFVGLFSPNMQGGVFNAITPFTSLKDTDRESLLRYLTRNLFGGGGAHSVFTKTIGAGLAYSNGVGGSLRDGTASYYAERMPDVTQTLHFVIDTIRQGPRDPRLTEYVMAEAFRGSNAAGSYEARARAIADDLADGITPSVVKHFRESILALRKEPHLSDDLFQRVDRVFGPIVPGYGPKAKEVPGAIYYLIGNDKQFKSLDADVQAREDERVYKLYPRDYWLM